MYNAVLHWSTLLFCPDFPMCISNTALVHICVIWDLDKSIDIQ